MIHVEQLIRETLFPEIPIIHITHQQTSTGKSVIIETHPAFFPSMSELIEVEQQLEYAFEITFSFTPTSSNRRSVVKALIHKMIDPVATFHETYDPYDNTPVIRVQSKLATSENIRSLQQEISTFSNIRVYK